MTFRLLPLFLLLVLLPGCVPMEPIHGCVMAAAKEREVLRAKTFLPASIPSKLLFIGFAGRDGHAVLIYRLNPEGWFVYDDTFGSRQLLSSSISMDLKSGFPVPQSAAHAAFPGADIAVARWYEPR